MYKKFLLFIYIYKYVISGPVILSCELCWREMLDIRNYTMIVINYFNILLTTRIKAAFAVWYRTVVHVMQFWSHLWALFSTLPWMIRCVMNIHIRKLSDSFYSESFLALYNYKVCSPFQRKNDISFRPKLLKPFYIYREKMIYVVTWSNHRYRTVNTQNRDVHLSLFKKRLLSKWVHWLPLICNCTGWISLYALWCYQLSCLDLLNKLIKNDATNVIFRETHIIWNLLQNLDFFFSFFFFFFLPLALVTLF